MASSTEVLAVPEVYAEDTLLSDGTVRTGLGHFNGGDAEGACNGSRGCEHGAKDTGKVAETGDGKSAGLPLRTGDTSKCDHKAKMVKPRQSDASFEADSDADGDDEEEENDDDYDAAMRSPRSRLAASFLMGRERVARAWRQGARRAGILGGTDTAWGDGDEEEEEDDDEETKQNDREPTIFLVSDRIISTRRSSISLQSDAMEIGAMPEVALDDDEVSPEEEEDRRGEQLTSLPVVAFQPGSAPRLVLSRLAPMTRVPKLAQLYMFLDRIECIVIRDMIFDNEEDGAVFYVLDVYHYQVQHSIPTQRHFRRTSTQIPSIPARRPAFQLQQRFSSFTKLRRRLLQASSRKHPLTPVQDGAPARPERSSHARCGYCHRMDQFLSSGTESIARLGWKTKLFTTPETRKALLSDFITELVFLAREQRDACSVLRTLATYQQPPMRYVHRSVPGILRRFLTGQTGETFMR